MTADEAAHATVAPRMRPVVDALSAHAKLPGDDLEFDPAPEQQQARFFRFPIAASP